MSTWPRTSGSNFYFGTGTTRATGNGITFSNGITMNSNIMDISQNNGTAFRFNKNGIYNILVSYTLAALPAPYTNAIDACTNTAYTTGGSTFIAQVEDANSTSAQLSYVGYLPSNASLWYKIRTNTAGTFSRANVYITFLYETPVYSNAVTTNLPFF